MKLEFIAIGNIDDSAVNMRHGKKAPDVSDILPTVRKRGIIVPVILRPGIAEGRFELVAGRRRVHAARIAQADEGADPELGRVPSAIMEAGDDAAALEASLIENIARLDPDEVTQWETFTRLVKEGREIDDIAVTFGLPNLMIRRVLALGNLLPRIRSLYAQEKIDRTTVRHLTLASKSQQKAWLALYDDPDNYTPTGHQLKAWLFGGQSIAARHALFELDAFDGATVADLFGEDRYFADPETFWTAQNAAIEARKAACLEEGWSDVVIVPASEHFHSWEYEKAAKRKGGRVYVDVHSTGEVTFHEGYLTRKEPQRAARGEGPEPAKIARPELTSTLQTYVDLHRHAAVRAALLTHPQVALRLMVAHAIVGSPLWRVSPEPQTTRNDEVRESIETARGETVFDERRRAVLDMLGFGSEEATVTGGNGDDYGVAGVFLRLIELPDPAVMEVITVVIGETLAAGSAAVEAVGTEIGIDMADWWQADDALFGLIRDREVLGRMVGEVAGQLVATANAGEKSKTLKRIIGDHLTVPMAAPRSSAGCRAGCSSRRAPTPRGAASAPSPPTPRSWPRAMSEACRSPRSRPNRSPKRRDGLRAAATPPAFFGPQKSAARLRRSGVGARSSRFQTIASGVSDPAPDRIAAMPSLPNRLASRSSPALSVVSSRSPVKIELAPAMKHSAWVLSLMLSRPADKRTMVVGMTIRATATVRTNSMSSILADGTSFTMSPSTVPAIGTSALSGTLSGGSERLVRAWRKPTRSSRLSPMPRMPPQQTFIPAARTRSSVSSRS